MVTIIRERCILTILEHERRGIRVDRSYQALDDTALLESDCDGQAHECCHGGGWGESESYELIGEVREATGGVCRGSFA